MVGPFEEGWVPAQAEPPKAVDLRGAAFGPRGFKIKNRERFATKRKAEDMDIDTPTQPDEHMLAPEDIITVRQAKKSKLNIVGAAKVRTNRSIRHRMIGNGCLRKMSRGFITWIQSLPSQIIQGVWLLGNVGRTGNPINAIRCLGQGTVGDSCFL